MTAYESIFLEGLILTCDPPRPGPTQLLEGGSTFGLRNHLQTNPLRVLGPRRSRLWLQKRLARKTLSPKPPATPRDKGAPTLRGGGGGVGVGEARPAPSALTHLSPTKSTHSRGRKGQIKGFQIKGSSWFGEGIRGEVPVYATQTPMAPHPQMVVLLVGHVGGVSSFLGLWHVYCVSSKGVGVGSGEGQDNLNTCGPRWRIKKLKQANSSHSKQSGEYAVLTHVNSCSSRRNASLLTQSWTAVRQWRGFPM